MRVVSGQVLQISRHGVTAINIRSGQKKGRLGTDPFVKRGCVIMQRLPWRQEEQGQKLQQWELPEPERVPPRVE